MKHTLLILAVILTAANQPTYSVDIYGSDKPTYTYKSPYSTIAPWPGDTENTRQDRNTLDEALADVRRREAALHPERYQTSSSYDVFKYDTAEERKKKAAKEGVNKALQKNNVAKKKKEEKQKKELEKAKAAEKQRPASLFKAAIGIILMLTLPIAFIYGWIWLEENWVKMFQGIGNIIYRIIKNIALIFTPKYIGTTIPCILLLLALAPRPYWYYTILRVTICAYAIGKLLIEPSNTRRIIYIGIALLYNPLAPVHLTRDIWKPVNLATIAILLLLRYLSPSPKAQQTKQANQANQTNPPKQPQAPYEPPYSTTTISMYEDNPYAQDIIRTPIPPNKNTDTTRLQK